MEMKTFTANWTTEDSYTDTDTIMSLAFSREIQEAINNETMVDIHKTQGWTVVALPRFKDMRHAVDVNDWCVVNVGAGKWNKFGSTYTFKEQKHAEWFILRWL